MPDDDRRPVEIAAYSPEWPRRFAAERDLLARVFTPDVFTIDHVGSTAVPALGAKPIVDILIGAPTLAEIEARIPAIEMLGYRYAPEHEAALPERHYFARPARHPRLYHVHAVRADSRFHREHLAFRDALRADAALAARYLTLKRALAARHGRDREGYTDAKAAFIRAVVDHRCA
jgi:GrpB-like predicted nucleotidyltransferase (UPF0157 family)